MTDPDPTLRVIPGGDLEVVPLADVVDHTPGPSCMCWPALEIHPGGLTLVVHHSMDGREATEATP